MTEYLLTVIGVILISSVLNAIVADGKTAGIIKNVTKLACVLVIVAPALTWVKGFSKKDEKASLINFSQTVIQTDENFIQYYSELRIEYAKDSLEQELKTRFQINTDVDIDWSFTVNKEIKIEKIFVGVESADLEFAEKISKYIETEYACEVETYEK